MFLYISHFGCIYMFHKLQVLECISQQTHYDEYYTLFVLHITYVYSRYGAYLIYSKPKNLPHF